MIVVVTTHSGVLGRVLLGNIEGLIGCFLNRV
jgi:hypothetical protein